MTIYDQRGSEVLDRDECLAMLSSAAAARRVGRVVVCTVEGPHVVPVDFSVVDQLTVFRTGPGFLAQHLEGRLVAFEADEVEDLGEGVRTGWSVVVRGAARELGDEEVAALGHRTPRPSVEVVGDRFFAIRTDEATGRRFGRWRRVSGPGRGFGERSG